MGWPEVDENGRKSQEQSGDHGGRRRRFAGPIRVRPAAVGWETSWPASSGCSPPPCPARVSSGRPVVPPLVKPPQLANGSKMA